MKITKTLKFSTGDIYSSFLKYQFDGFNNTDTYLINLDIETQNPQGGEGMTLSTEKIFNVSYPILRVLNKPVVTQLLEKSAVEVNWAGICLNPGITSGKFSYVDNFIKFGNKALQLEVGSTLRYNTTVVPTGSTRPFMIKIPETYNGIIYEMNDGKYKLGYDLSKQKFYTIINDITVYSNVIKITENPFYFTMLDNRVVIRQYNIYNEVKNIYDLKVSDLYELPVEFMVQTNN